MLLSALLVLPFAGAAVLWSLPSPAMRAHAELACAAAVLILALGLLVGPAEPMGVIVPDRLGITVTILAALTTAMRAWAQRRRTGRSALARAAGLIGLGGLVLSVLSADSLLTWFGLLIVMAAALFPALPFGHDRVVLAGTGLGVAFFGIIAHRTDTQVGASCMLAGYAILAALLPEPPLLALLLVPRLLAVMPGSAAMSWLFDAMLLTLGLGTMLAAAAGALVSHMPSGQRDRLFVLGQTGAGVFAFGLGSPEGAFAGCVQLMLLTLAQAAAGLARDGGPQRPLAIAGLGGLPPFGVFAGLGLILVAIGGESSWLLAMFLLGAAGIGWAAIAALSMPSRARSRATVAWVPLCLAVILGMAMPQPVASWFQAAVEIRR